MKLEKSVQQWIVLIAGILLQTAIGGIYAWSTFVPSLVEDFGFSRAQTGLLFGVQIIVFTVVTLPAGKLLQKKGPRFTALTGSLLFGLGYILASFTGDSFPLMLLSLGGITGVGIGMVYVCPLTTGMKWFPQNRGMVTGAAVAGFGAGAIVLSNVAEHLMIDSGMIVHQVFRFTGILFGGIALLSSLFLAFPREEKKKSGEKEHRSVISLLLSRNYLILALGMFTGTFAGLLLSAHLKPFVLSLQMSESQAVLTISLFAVGNTIGRLTWGAVHDKVGDRRTILFSQLTLLFAVLAIALVTITGMTGAVFPLVVLIGFGFGACFVVYAAAITDTFGVDLMPRLYPVSFIGYGVAALIGPSIGGAIADQTGSYLLSLFLSAVLIFIALGSVFFFYNSKSIQKGGDQ